MSDERYDFTVLRPIPGRQDRTAYLPGEGIMAQVVDDLGLVVGEDVEPARANSMDMPAGNASRNEWARYAEIQASASGGPTQVDIDAMTRDQLRDLYVPPEPEPAPPPAKHVKAAKATEPSDT